MFVRVKNIKGRKYAYLVENEWTPWGSRQRVTKYLGKLVSLERVKDDSNELPNGFRQTVIAAVEQELHNHGFTDGKKDKVCVDLERGKVEQEGKNVVLALNEGYLCEHTLKSILDYTPGENPTENANKLANLALEAGLKLSGEQFLHVFEQVKI